MDDRDSAPGVPKCHQNERKEGLVCLRRQLGGDELLTWTIETFTMFYDKTWAQRFAFPLFGLIPVFMSIVSFIYDYYSDFELTFEYYNMMVRDLPDLALNQSAEDIADPGPLAPGPECQISAANETHAVVPKNLSIYLCLKHLVVLFGSGSSPDATAGFPYVVEVLAAASVFVVSDVFCCYKRYTISKRRRRMTCNVPNENEDLPTTTMQPSAPLYQPLIMTL